MGDGCIASSFLSFSLTSSSNAFLSAHTLSVLSAAPLMTCSLGSAITHLTDRLCPLRVLTHWPVAISHTLSVLSLFQAPLMTCPLGSTATQVTESLCPLRVLTHWPEAISHTL